MLLNGEPEAKFRPNHCAAVAVLAVNCKRGPRKIDDWIWRKRRFAPLERKAGSTFAVIRAMILQDRLAEANDHDLTMPNEIRNWIVIML